MKTVKLALSSLSLNEKIEFAMRVGKALEAHELTFPLQPVVWFGIFELALLAIALTVTESFRRRIDTNNHALVARVVIVSSALQIAGLDLREFLILALCSCHLLSDLVFLLIQPIPVASVRESRDCDHRNGDFGDWPDGLADIRTRRWKHALFSP